MKKSKIDICKFATRNDYTSSLEENVIEQANLLEPSNTKLDDIDKQFFEMGLEIDATIESLAILTIYNWQSTNITDSLIFLAVSHMWNSIRHTIDNGKSSTLYYYCIQSNLDSGHI